jgi:uncharacterized protein YqgC (DUF456 family)
MRLVDTFLMVCGWTAFGIAIVVAQVLNVLGLFGNWLILAAVACAWVLTGFVHFDLVCLGILLVLAIVGEVLETALAAYGATKFGGGKGSAWAALAGCILGAIAGSPLLPVVGTLIGACIGAFVAAAIYEYIQMEKQVHQALWTGLGAAIGKIAGQMAKVFVGIAMLLVAFLRF